jgi:hypothetical protein
MKRYLLTAAGGSFLLISTVASRASAQAVPVPDGTEDAPQNAAPVPPQPPAETESSRRGFRGSASVGASLPLGDDAGKGLDEAFGLRLPMSIDLGAFVFDGLYVGGFIGTSVGSGISSDSNGPHGVLQLGLASEYLFAPDSALTPWVRYGAGYELSSLPGGHGNYFVDATGIELARITAGLEYRGNRGADARLHWDYYPSLYVDVVVTDYLKMSAVGPDASQANLDKAVHMWTSIGLRMAFMP